MKRQNKIIFLTKTDNIKIENKSIDIILSPEYYWVKKVRLPVSKVKAAYKLLPAIFDEILPSNDKYDYQVSLTNEKNVFIAIAFSKQKILESLKKQIEPFSSVKMIYFAEFELSKEIQQCIKINQKSALIKIDGLLLYAKGICNNKTTINDIIQDITLSRHAISSSEFFIYNIPKKATLALLGSLFFLTTLFVADSGYYLYLNKSIKKHIEKVKHYYNIPYTSFQLNSILSRLQKIDKKQIKIRTLMKDINDMPLNKNTKLTEVLINKNAFEVTLQPISKKDKKNIISYLSSKTKHINSSYKNSKLKVNISYD